MLKNVTRTFFFWPLVLTILLVIAQVFPFPGIFLMFAGGAILTGIAFLAFVAGLALDCITGRVPTIFLLGPIGYFVGYYALYAYQGVQVGMRESELQASNPGQLLAFDPGSHSLVTKSGGVVSGFRIPVSYQRNENYKPEEYLSFRIVPKSVCRSVPRDSLARIHGMGFHATNPSGKRRRVRNLCKLRYPERPKNEIVEVVVKDQEIWRRKATIEEGIYTLKFQGRVLGEYRTASVYRYNRFPFLFFGCFLNSGAPSWECRGGFQRHLYELDTTPSEAKANGRKTAIGIMLGLERYSWKDLNKFEGYPQNTASLARVAGEAGRVTDETFDELRRMMKDPSMKMPWRFGYSLASHRDRVRLAADDVVAAFEKFAKSDPEIVHQAENKANAIATAVAALPEEKFSAYGPKIFAIIKDGEWWSRRPALYIRAADAGAHTLEKYKSDLISDRSARWLRFAPPLAICRLREVDDQTLKLLKEKLAGVDPNKYDDEHQAIFLALLRHRQHSTIKSYLAVHKPRQVQWYEKVISVHAEDQSKMPNNCMVRRWPGGGYLPSVMKGEYQ